MMLDAIKILLLLLVLGNKQWETWLWGKKKISRERIVVGKKQPLQLNTIDRVNTLKKPKFF